MTVLQRVLGKWGTGRPRAWRWSGAIAVALAGTAHAAPAPRLVPDQDVTVEYQLDTRDHEPVSVSVAITAGGRFLHITSPDLPTTILVNRDTGRAAILLPMLRAYADLNIARYDLEQTILRGASFSRGPDRRIAGQTCTMWHAASRKGEADACITADGVILRGEANSDRKGEVGSIQARRVSYGPLPRDMFEIPADFRKSPIPIGAEGIGQ